MLKRREFAKNLIIQGFRRKDVKLQIQEEFGASQRAAHEDYDVAYSTCMELRQLRCEQLSIAESMYMGGFRNTRIVDALIENWGIGGENCVQKFILTEEEADELVQRARQRVDGETPKTKEGKRERLALWFEDKMMHAAKDRDQIRAAALYMRLEGLADQSEYEPPQDDIVIELGDWKTQYQKQLADGSAPSAAAPIGERDKPKGVEVVIEE